MKFGTELSGMKRVHDVYAGYCHLVSLAEKRFAEGDVVGAIRLAQMAARYAYPATAGLFASPRLERLILELGRRIPSVVQPPVVADRDKRSKVLHVLTYGRPIGGDTRFVWRWIQEDRHNRHFVAITTQVDIQDTFAVPEALRRSAEQSGGFLRILAAPSSNPCEQASELRALCQEMTFVVLHVFPYDVIPILALAKDCEAVRTIYVNHSDHTYWLGASVANCVAHLRSQSSHFLDRRRCLQPGKSALLPIPLEPSYRSMTRAQAKRSLGFGSEVVLLLTIASPFKYGSPGQLGLLDLAAPVIVESKRAVLIAVGPKRTGMWAAAYAQTGGRVRALSTRWDNEVFYTAADIYLDSVPFSSITSLLEAGRQGAALIGYRSADPAFALLGPGAPGLDDTMEFAEDVASYRTLLARLIEDEAFRSDSAARSQRAIATRHQGTAWVRAVDNAYAVARNCERGCLNATRDKFVADELGERLSCLYGDWNMRQMVRNFLRPLPYGAKLSISRQLYLGGINVSALVLLPRPLHALAHAAARWTKRCSRRLAQLWAKTSGASRIPV
jgi:hypothetical protein